MAKAKVLSLEQTAILEAYAERIATIDPADTFGLLDMGEVLVTVEEQFGRKPMEACAATSSQSRSTPPGQRTARWVRTAIVWNRWMCPLTSS